MKKLKLAHESIISRAEDIMKEESIFNSSTNSNSHNSHKTKRQKSNPKKDIKQTTKEKEKDHDKATVSTFCTDDTTKTRSELDEDTTITTTPDTVGSRGQNDVYKSEVAVKQAITEE
eukprot:CAMPEP_0115044196 /NCGR_PEP_ID=MMETSP0216-20121206/47328_1 /TAXON_ID=223996 /ORGANISM="Protocruzia adherens, Strain Boccale" /LENGTH=116 /DNA_ID=CAMNT_0002426677 /DNA_START=245 /DNA_END=595 /DNA_ORIENTATION=-